MRRLRLDLTGHTFGRDNTFALQVALSRSDLALGARRDAPLLDAYVRFRQLRDLNVQFGQFKLPHSRLRIASSGDLMFVERPFAENAFTLDRDLGLMIRSDDFLGADLLSYWAGVFAGQGRGSFVAHEATPLLMARISLRPFGRFDEYSQPDLARTPSPKLAIAGTFAHHRNAHGARNVDFNPANSGRTLSHGEVDLVFKWSGWSVHGGFYWRGGDEFAGSTLNGTGFYAATGLVFPRHPLDLAVRYSETRPEDDASALPDFHEFTVAMSWYLADHFLKLTADYSRLWDTVGFGEGGNQARVQMEVRL